MLIRGARACGAAEAPRKRAHRQSPTLAVAILAALLLLPGAGAVAAEPKVTIKSKGKRLTPGKKVKVKVRGFNRRDRVRYQFGIESDPPANCCVSKSKPRRGKPGILLDRRGSLKLKVRMPKRYAQCVGVNCSSPNWQRYRRGDEVFLSVYTDDASRSARDVGTVKPRRGKRGAKLVVRPDPITQGERIRFVGRRWPKRKRVGLYIGVPNSEGLRVGTARTDRRGRFSERIGPIEAEPGRYVALACRPASSCRKKRSDRFTVEAPGSTASGPRSGKARFYDARP